MWWHQQRTLNPGPLPQPLPKIEDAEGMDSESPGLKPPCAI